MVDVKASVCLGVFEQLLKSMMTVQNKIYEGLAMAKPVISGELGCGEEVVTLWRTHLPV